MGRGTGGHFSRGASHYHFTPCLARLGTQIDDVICGGDHGQFVFYDEDRVATIDETLQQLEQIGHVLVVQAGTGSSRM